MRILKCSENLFYFDWVELLVFYITDRWWLVSRAQKYSVLVKDVTRYMGFWLHLLFTHQMADRIAMK